MDNFGRGETFYLKKYVCSRLYKYMFSNYLLFYYVNNMLKNINTIGNKRVLYAYSVCSTKTIHYSLFVILYSFFPVRPYGM